MHPDKKPFKCDICEKCFNEKSHLVNHIRIHTGEKPFECNVCKMRFRHRGNLNQHIKNKHSDKNQTIKD